MEGKKLNFNAPLLSVRVNRKIKEAPRPARHLSLPPQKSDGEFTEVAKPAAVPFEWEQTPGRPKDGSASRSSSPQSITPRFPPGRIFDNVKRVSGEQFEDRTVCKPHTEVSSLEENLKDIKTNMNTGSQSDDEEFADALDTLLASDSFSWNCSVSGFSGYDGPYVKSSRTFTADPKTREFMMTRFLPAARAMVIETPQHAPRKTPEVNEQPRQVKKVLSGELRPLLEKYGANTVSPYGQYKGSVASEDEYDNYDNGSRKSFKACGLLPRLCVKNSLCLLDPVPGMKSRAQSPISSGREVRRMARTAYSGPLPQIQHEKHDWNVIYWKNIKSGVQSRGLVENKLTSISDQFNRSRDFRTTDISPHIRSRAGGISPYRSEKTQSPFRDGRRFLGIPKIVKDDEPNEFNSINKGSDKFRDVSSRQICEGSGSFGTLVEKTVYIDSQSSVKMPMLDSAFSKIEGGKKVKETVDSRVTEKLYTPKSLTAREKIVKPKAIRSLDADLPSSPHNSILKGRGDSTEDLKSGHYIDQKDFAKKYGNTTKVSDQGNSNVGSLQSPQPPPLPKSPSESWLWRTVPSVSIRNPFSQAQTKKQGPKTSTNVPKWETIVKTSHLHPEHLCYSEELISHVPRHSKA